MLGPVSTCIAPNWFTGEISKFQIPREYLLDSLFDDKAWHDKQLFLNLKFSINLKILW